MKYIKVRFNLTTPASEDFESYGWDTVWNKKAEIRGGEAVEPGNVVNFQPVTIRRDGKCLILGTKRNIIALRSMNAIGQIKLGPGETLELPDEAPAVAAPKPVDEWPAEPGAESEREEGEVLEEEVVPVVHKKRAKATLDNMTPDKE